MQALLLVLYFTTLELVLHESFATFMLIPKYDRTFSYCLHGLGNLIPVHTQKFSL